MKQLINKSYQITKRRGLITSKTSHVDFYHKAVEEMKEIKAEFTQPDNLDKTLMEVGDLVNVGLNWLNHYGDPIEILTRVNEKNESRISKT